MSRRAAMILAAGFGTRMGTLTRDRPKPLIEVAGRALIDHAVEAVADASPVVVNGHYQADQLRAYLSTAHPNARFIEEPGRILDSGGGVKHALPLLGSDPILTLNADAVWQGPTPQTVLEAAWEPDRMEGLILLVPRARAVGRPGGGDVAQAADGRLTWDKSDRSMVYTGAQILRTDRIAGRKDTVFSLREVWHDMMGAGGLFGVLYPGKWADVGHPEGILEAERMVANAV